jgi:5-hydroxyisourate hydrolase-like protein (transthyretin family)
MRHFTSTLALLAVLAAPAIAGDHAGNKGEGKHHAEKLAKYDTNHDGKLDDGERAAMLTAKSAELKTKHPELFAQIDTNHDGQISAEEWKAAKDLRHARHDAKGK